MILTLSLYPVNNAAQLVHESRELLIKALIYQSPRLTGQYEKSPDGGSHFAQPLSVRLDKSNTRHFGRHQYTDGDQVSLLSLVSLPVSKSATSHFSPFVFTRTLLPLMTDTSRKPGSDVRIVTVRLLQALLNQNVTSLTRLKLGSVAHTQSQAKDPKIKFSELEDFNHEYASDFYPDWSRYGTRPDHGIKRRH